MSITVYFIGLVYFHTPDGGPGTRRVFMPDGRSPEEQSGIPPHFASILTAIGEATSPDGTWNPETNDDLAKLGIQEFRIAEPSTVRIQQAVGGVDTSAHDNRLPRLTGQGTPPFRLNRLNPQTIVNMTISGGTLKAGSILGAAVTEWVTEDSGPTTIRAGQKTLEVRENSVVLFLNTSDLLEKPSPMPTSHFVLYGRLASQPRPRTLDEPKESTLPALAVSHRYLTEVAKNYERARRAVPAEKRPFLPLPGCSNTCC